MSVSMAGLPREVGVREQVAWLASLGARAVTLDAGVLRARDLDRSARRDVASMLRRAQLELAGIDAWIPPEHFERAETADRAIAAVVGACELASELALLVGGGSRAVVSIMLPGEGAGDAALAIASAAERVGAVVADHAWPVSPRDDIGVGVDPAAVLMGGGDPAAAVSGAGTIASARLGDVSAHGRIAVGDRGSRLDVLAYQVALSTAGYAGHVVVDPRGVADAEHAIQEGLDAFTPPFTPSA